MLAGAALRFADGDRTLLLDPASGSVRIGGVAIGLAPAPLGAPVSADASQAFAMDRHAGAEVIAPPAPGDLLHDIGLVALG